MQEDCVAHVHRDSSKCAFFPSFIPIRGGSREEGGGFPKINGYSYPLSLPPFSIAGMDTEFSSNMSIIIYMLLLSASPLQRSAQERKREPLVSQDEWIPRKPPSIFGGKSEEGGGGGGREVGEEKRREMSLLSYVGWICQ